LALDQLAGKSILVTRPSHQAGYLSRRIKELGGRAWLFPVLEIADSKDKQPLLDIIAQLNNFSLAVFVSPNAVERVMPLIDANGRWPKHVRVATVGKGSANALKRCGIAEVIVPDDGSDSEALLRMPQLQNMQDKRVIIFRGNDGRKLLGDILRERGAKVEYVECYRRYKPEIDPSPLLRYWHDNGIQAVTISSSEGLHNLFDMLGETGQKLLKITTVFTAHERIERKARELGVEKIYRTPLGDEGTIQGLLTYFEEK
jgi:uroporphyrinogen-III synthase